MHIEIKIPLGNPWKTACMLMMMALIAVPFYLNGQRAAVDAHEEDVHVHEEMGADEAPSGGAKDPMAVAAATADVNRERLKQEVLKRREEILRYQLLQLEDEARTLKTPDAIAALSSHRRTLIDLIRTRETSEKLLLSSLQELWDAQGIDVTTVHPSKTIALSWPVEPTYGLSARFKDDAYQARFGIPHHAIDIPIEQGSEIYAAADGVVKTVADNGLGYSYVVLAHRNGIETIYGHVSGFLVQEGQEVRTGETIALSGGRPGSKGAGLLTTGPHLHFAVRADGALTDPLEFLTPWKGMEDLDE